MIRVGIGGWTFEPWRDNFYPKGLSKAKELSFASRALTTIEINSTFYSSQKPATFKRWADETPDDFVFSVKASRFCVNRRVLAEAKESVEWFVGTGITALGKKLGPILWQVAPTKKFDRSDFGAFLALLPRTQDGIALRHAVEARHESFCTAEFVELARKHGVAIVFADSAKYPAIADPTADFFYARLQQSEASVKTGYAPKALKEWRDDMRTWEEGGVPKRFKTLSKAPSKLNRDVFVYIISGAKERAPAAAMELLKLLK
jgi:uncharacterized protein YecE (DUF72 family)